MQSTLYLILLAFHGTRDDCIEGMSPLYESKRDAEHRSPSHSAYAIFLRGGTYFMPAGFDSRPCDSAAGRRMHATRYGSERASGDPASGDPASGDPASGEAASGEAASGEAASGEAAGNATGGSWLIVSLGVLGIMGCLGATSFFLWVTEP